MSTLFSQKLSKNNEIRPQEADFTEVLNTIALKPKKLYFYGKLPENQLENGCKKTRVRPKTLAVVGTRKPTKYGEEVAYNLAYAAAKRGAVVVSGLAYGIDSIAHRAALDAGGVTVAVLGTPIDNIYPKAHYRLAEEIVEKGGVVLSELAPGAEFFPKTSFLQRNRLISGLSDVVVIPEAAERSGSLNTAAHALEQGREVFAVPGDITRPLSKGCNRLISQGAIPYLEPADVLDLLFPVPVQKKRATQEALIGDNDGETAILAKLRAGIQQGEAILTETGLVPAVFNQHITMLEIKGRVRALGCNRWALK